jgi:hypothetical protein
MSSVVILEPVGDHRIPSPVYRRVTSPGTLATLRRFLDNDSARFARRLHHLARQVAAAGRPQPLYIALVKGGNHARMGFRLQGESGHQTAHPRTPYLKLGFRKKRFRTTLLHETGHVVLGLLSGGRGLPSDSLAALPHSTAAITGRVTAFNEGFAIHLETVMAHLSRDPVLQQRYHRQLRRGRVRLFDLTYFHPARDVLTYAQGYARYVAVRDNEYSFASAHRQGNYYRIQLDRARDLAQLRTADQLLASEGFVATFFFHLALRRHAELRGRHLPQAYGPILRALWRLLTPAGASRHQPLLTDFVTAFGRESPEHGRAACSLLFDLSHGAFFLPSAQARWRRLYRAALRIELGTFKREALALASLRARAVKQCQVDPRRLRARMGPVLPVTVKGVSVTLPRLMGGRVVPLTFDANTVQAGVLRLISGMTSAQVSQFIAARDRRPFQNRADLMARGGLLPAVLGRWTFQ